MSQAVLCEAIRGQNLVQFYYSGEDAPGLRLVEPHMIAYTTADNLVLSSRGILPEGSDVFPHDMASHIISVYFRFLQPCEKVGGTGCVGAQRVGGTATRRQISEKFIDRSGR